MLNQTYFSVMKKDKHPKHCQTSIIKLLEHPLYTLNQSLEIKATSIHKTCMKKIQFKFQVNNKNILCTNQFWIYNFTFESPFCCLLMRLCKYELMLALLCLHPYYYWLERMTFQNSHHKYSNSSKLTIVRVH